MTHKPVLPSAPASDFKVYRYRWAVLLAFVLMALMTQVLWITFAPVTSAAADFYGTSDLNIGLRHILPIYVPLSIVAAYGVAEAARRAVPAFSRAALMMVFQAVLPILHAVKVSVSSVITAISCRSAA